MIAALLLYTCALTGGDCYFTVINDQVPKLGCDRAGMIEAARFIGDHPNRRFVRYVCDDPRKVPFYLGREQA
ncbi:MAG: hypothetical protein ACREDO_04620 [Methyloceanibacter sp.]